MSDPVVLRLSHLAYLHVTGADALDFLQGQFSSDLRQLDAGQAQLSSYNSPKGRMLAVLQLLRIGDATVLELHGSLREAVHRRLKMFVLRSKVSIDDAGNELRAIGVAGSAAAWLSAHGLPVPEDGTLRAAARSDGVTVLRRFGAIERYSVHGPAALLAPLLSADAAPEDERRWRRLDIEAGVPLVLPETSDQFVAQMCNVDRLGGIGLNKGCYTGQEIIARLHYLGTLKRRMFLLRGVGDAPAPGAPVREGGDATQSVGAIVDAAADGDGFVASAVLQLSHAQSAALRVGDSSISTPQAYL